MVSNLDGKRPLTHRWWEDVSWAAAIMVSSLVIGLGIQAGMFSLSLWMGWAAWANLPAFATVFSAIPLQLSSIWMVAIRARRSSDGDLVQSLAAGPIQRSRVFMGVLVFELGGTAYALARMLTLPEHAAIRHHVYFPLVAALRAGPILATGYVLMITVLAPISEELFFRGWLWTALRPSWGVWPTALLTGGVWLTFTAFFEPRALPFLLLSAVTLSLVRYYTGSVRATIAVHMIENIRLVVMTSVALAVLRH